MPTPISTLVKAPDLSLAVKMVVTRGRKNVMQQIATYLTRFIDGSINEFIWRMDGSAVKVMEATEGLTLFTDQPLEVVGFKAGQEVLNIRVNRMLFCDMAFDSLTITNPGPATANVQVIQHTP